MTVRELAEKLGLDTAAGASGLDREAKGGYASDLLSDVMGRAGAGSVWVTLQTHQNIVAVASLKEMAAVVLVSGRAPEPATAAKADEEGIPLLVSPHASFDTTGRLYELGLRGTDAQAP